MTEIMLLLLTLLLVVVALRLAMCKQAKEQRSGSTLTPETICQAYGNNNQQRGNSHTRYEYRYE